MTRTKAAAVVTLIALLAAAGVIGALLTAAPEEKDWMSQIDQIEPESALAALAEPMTEEDVRHVLDTYDAVRGSDEYTRWRDAHDELHDEYSVLERLTVSFRERAERKALADLEMSFFGHVAVYGHERHRGSLLRVSGVASAARQLAGTHGLPDPASAEVVPLMLTARPAAQARLERTLADAPPDALDKRGTSDPELSALMGEPGTIALAHMPEDSIRQWGRLDPDVRRRLVQLPDEAARDYPESVLVLLWDGAPDFVAAQINVAFRATRP